jgi:hypothetical protein
MTCFEDGWFHNDPLQGHYQQYQTSLQHLRGIQQNHTMVTYCWNAVW